MSASANPLKHLSDDEVVGLACRGGHPGGEDVQDATERAIIRLMSATEVKAADIKVAVDYLRLKHEMGAGAPPAKPVLGSKLDGGDND